MSPYISPECLDGQHDRCEDPGGCACPGHEDDLDSLVYGGTA
jgi:hypothetical protein